jgi:hypothetical protein
MEAVKVTMILTSALLIALFKRTKTHYPEYAQVLIRNLVSDPRGQHHKMPYWNNRDSI